MCFQDTLEIINELLGAGRPVGKEKVLKQNKNKVRKGVYFTKELLLIYVISTITSNLSVYLYRIMTRKKRYTLYMSQIIGFSLMTRKYPLNLRHLEKEVW